MTNGWRHTLRHGDGLQSLIINRILEGTGSEVSSPNLF